MEKTVQPSGATSEDDVLYGDGAELAGIPGSNAGNDYLDGGDGVDVLIGGAGEDILAGGKNEDFLYTEGNDTIVFNPDDGIDTVTRNDAGAHSRLTYRFGAGIDPNTFKLRQGSLMLDFGNGDAIHINDIDHQDVFNSLENSRFEFADGTVLDGQQVLAASSSDAAMDRTRSTVEKGRTTP